MRDNPWIRFIGRRLAGLVFALLFLLVVVFMTVRLIPGDPVQHLLGEQSDPGARERITQELGLDRPLISQFFAYVGDLAHGDFGNSLRSGQPVGQLISERIGGSLALAGAALALTLLIGIPLGILVGALTQNGRRRRLDVGYQTITQILATIPEFLAAVVLAYVFAVRYQLLPVAGQGGIRNLVLPVAALTIGAAAALSRFVRVETVNVLAQDYIRTARSARLPWRIVYGREVLPNVLTAALTIGGLLLAGLIGGAVIVENVFALPGLGTALAGAIEFNDYTVIQGIILVLGIIVIVVNTIVDVLLALIDKRSLARVS